FFFSSRRRHTRSKRDWSSDVCSSDLGDQIRQQLIPVGADLLPALRVARFLLVKDQLLRADIKKRCGKYLCMDAPALLLQLRPVRSEERRVGKEGCAQKAEGEE